jgi:hypothetical protein
VCPKRRCILQRLILLIGFSIIFSVFFVCRLFIIVEGGSWIPYARIDVNIHDKAPRSFGEVLGNYPLDDTTLEILGKRLGEPN